MTKEIQQETIRGIALRAKALGGRAMLVGGCVRDALTGRQSADIDCEVYGLAPQALRSLAAEFGEVDESGARYGIFSLKGAGIDLAVPRLERRTGPKHGDFDVRLDPALPFARAAARRDFTVNAILRDALTGEIVDPFGGREDLSAGVLRCVGDPARRFAEDALRILRLLRFASVLGFSVEENTARAARERRDGLRAIAHERVYAELNKLLCGEHAAAVLLEYPDILGVVLPEILPCVGFDQRNPHHCYDVWGHTARAVGAAPPTRVLRWTMLLHDLGKPKYFTRSDMHQDDYRVLMASCCIPVACKPIVIDGIPYYDGALGDTIPLKKAFADGCDKVVLILTRPEGTVRADSTDRKLARVIRRRYPKAAEQLALRAQHYNEGIALAEQLAAEGKVLIIAPDDTCGVKTLTRDQEALKKLYSKGIRDAQAIEAFIK